jgi:hypothetical protein
MISFKYYVEVVVDIQGRLGAQERAMAGLTGMTSMTMSGGDDLENERGGMTASGAYMVDTAPVRRDKGVVSATFEVVIGTRDSERRKGKQKEEETPVIPEEPPAMEPRQHDQPTNGGADRPYSGHPSEDDYWGYNYYDWTQGDANGYDHWDYHGNGWEAPPQIPMPHLPDESQLSDKERARRAEERLLPSQPPGMEQQAGEGSHAATAPYLPGENVPGLYGAPIPAYEPHLHSLSVPANAAIQTPYNDESAPAPEYFPVAGSSNHVPAVVPVDDKQELQRQQLEAEASAPPEDDEDLYAGSDAPSSGTATVHLASAPSAPGQVPQSPDGDGDDTLVPDESILNHDSHAEATGESDLPRYEPKSPVSSAEPQHLQPEPATSHEAAAAPVALATETGFTATGGHSHDAWCLIFPRSFSFPFILWYHEHCCSFVAFLGREKAEKPAYASSNEIWSWFIYILFYNIYLWRFVDLRKMWCVTTTKTLSNFDVYVINDYKKAPEWQVHLHIYHTSQIDAQLFDQRIALDQTRSAFAKAAAFHLENIPVSMRWVVRSHVERTSQLCTYT